MKKILFWTVASIITVGFIASAQTCYDTECIFKQELDSCAERFGIEDYRACYGDYIFDYCNQLSDDAEYDACLNTGDRVRQDHLDRLKQDLDASKNGWVKTYLNGDTNSPMIVKTGFTEYGNRDLSVGCHSTRKFIRIDTGLNAPGPADIYLVLGETDVTAYPFENTENNLTLINPGNPSKILARIRNHSEFAIAATNSEYRNMLSFETTDLESVLGHIQRCNF